MIFIFWNQVIFYGNPSETAMRTYIASGVMDS
jgi:hypothetical protein